MATLTIEYNPRSNFANALISLIKSSNSIKIVEKSTKESPYDPKYVEEIKATDRRTFKKEMFLQNLAAAGKEAKQIAAGKKKGKTLDELLK